MTDTDPAWWQTAQAWLYAWDFAADRAHFLRVDRDLLAQSSFLDQRIATDTANPDEVPIGELLAEPVPGTSSTPTGFIFHTAFCCSTLLARSLDLPGRSLVLREPATLLQLADLKRGLTTSTHSESTLLPLTLDFLARPFAPDERVIVKPTNVVNNLAADILALRPAARALVLYDELEPFLLAVLKRPRESKRGIEQFLTRLLADPSGRAWAAEHALPKSLAERAALVWALQILALRALLAGAHADRIRLLAAPELLADPAAALTASAAWLGLELPREEAAAIAAGPLWTRHAKHPALPYTPEQRREEQALARRLLTAPIREGLRYAGGTASVEKSGFPADLALLS
ncbi:MAG: hypothetical protein ACRESG_07150 [Gammaproteobacteria bacterium]